MALFRSGACPLLFCLMGGHPSWTFRRCSAMDLRTPVMSEGFQANMSRLLLRWIATFIPFAVVGSLGRDLFGASATILHSTGVVVLLGSVTIPPPTRNFSSSWAVDGTP
ncbi:hypothetical protein Tco_0040667 [Tanacetum coccineum]